MTQKLRGSNFHVAQWTRCFASIEILVSIWSNTCTLFVNQIRKNIKQNIVRKEIITRFEKYGLRSSQSSTGNGENSLEFDLNLYLDFYHDIILYIKQILITLAHVVSQLYLRRLYLFILIAFNYSTLFKYKQVFSEFVFKTFTNLDKKYIKLHNMIASNFT